MLYMAGQRRAKESVASGSVIRISTNTIRRKFMFETSFLLEILAVVGSVFANKFVHLGEIRPEGEGSRHSPRPYKDIRIFQSGFVLERIVVAAAETLDH